MDDDIENVIDALDELVDDTTVPQSVRAKLSEVISSLREENCDEAIKVNKVLDDLEEISNDANLPSYTRTQLWNVSCLLEMMQ